VSVPINTDSTNYDEIPFDKFPFVEPIAQVDQSLDLPLAQSKGTRACTKPPYPFSKLSIL